MPRIATWQRRGKPFTIRYYKETICFYTMRIRRVRPKKKGDKHVYFFVHDFTSCKMYYENQQHSGSHRGMGGEPTNTYSIGDELAYEPGTDRRSVSGMGIGWIRPLVSNGEATWILAHSE